MLYSPSDDALYHQIAEQLRERIAGQPSGTALPGEAALAKELRVSRDTVRDAIAELAHEGLVETHRGRRTVVRGGAPRTVVPLPGDADVTARMPSPAERASHAIARGVPVLVVVDAFGSALYPADRNALRTESRRP